MIKYVFVELIDESYQVSALERLREVSKILRVDVKHRSRYAIVMFVLRLRLDDVLSKPGRRAYTDCDLSHVVRGPSQAYLVDCGVCNL